jgi:sugar/nucleoside kinase (ribokinase family)
MQVAAPASELVDSTGAGEVLAGVFLALRAAGVPVRAALGYGVRAASAKVAEFGVDGERLRRELAAIAGEVKLAVIMDRRL